jgi:hypothetical protein
LLFLKCSSEPVVVVLRDLSYVATRPDMLGPQVPTCLLSKIVLHTAFIGEHRHGGIKVRYVLAKSDLFPSEIRETAGYVPVAVGISL